MQIAVNRWILYMQTGTNGHTEGKRASAPQGDYQRYAWKARSYVVPEPTRKGFQWKASALRGLQKFNKVEAKGPVTVVVPALYNFMPAEAVALGWLNEIDALGVIRHRIADVTKLTGWDVFTFHTRHNLDPFYASTIAAVRDTWLHEGGLTQTCINETVRRYGAAYHYNSVPARMVENLVLQSVLMGWLSSRAGDVPFRYHVLGTGLIAALVWSGSLTFESAVNTAVRVGSRWDASLKSLAREEVQKSGKEASEANLGWLYFHRVREILEGRSVLSLAASKSDVPLVEAPSRPFWFSVTAHDEPVLLETVRDVQWALESLNLASWAPRIPRPLPATTADVKGWLVSPQHPMASACRWSVYNYLLATPNQSLLFLDHIAAMGRRPALAPELNAPQQGQFQQDRLLSRIKVTGP
ncbi:MAG TPA: hypothetical protein VFR05_04540 [Terriglobia bacterium]|nr:hypothetical protein [Terriglobia bacterium]